MEITQAQTSTALSPLQAAGTIANAVAAQHVFDDYLSRRADNTLKAQRYALTAFSRFLDETGVAEISADLLQHQPTAWRGITWGLVEAFVKWCINAGYAIATTNNYLSAIKVYVKLAHKAETVTTDEFQRIRTVTGYSQKEGKRIDERRDVQRIGTKKADHVSLTPKQAQELKTQPDTPQGRRDTLLMCLLLDHGLRVSEAEILTVDNFDLKRGELRFYRPKVDKTQTHKLTADTLRALQRYMVADAPAIGRILHGSRRGGRLTGGMSKRAITARVKALGEEIGVFGLSAHDCRHFWATDAARNRTDAFVLQEAGGWSSLAMPRRYVEAAKIANEGVKLTNS